MLFSPHKFAKLVYLLEGDVLFYCSAPALDVLATASHKVLKCDAFDWLRLELTALVQVVYL